MIATAWGELCSCSLVESVPGEALCDLSALDLCDRISLMGVSLLGLLAAILRISVLISLVAGPYSQPGPLAVSWCSPVGCPQLKIADHPIS